MKPGLYPVVERNGKYAGLVFPNDHPYKDGSPLPFDTMKNVGAAMKKIREERDIAEGDELVTYRFGKVKQINE